MLAASLGFLSFTVEESFLVPVVAKVARSLVFDQTGPQFFLVLGPVDNFTENWRGESPAYCSILSSWHGI